MKTKQKELKPTVHGVGINDADYNVCECEYVVVGGEKKKRIVWTCPYYEVWKGVLERCYSKALHKKRPTYIGCTISEEWKYFSSFRSWMVQQDWEGLQLDKDLLFEGNRIYSSETCVFVSGVVNTFTIDSGASRGRWPLGVSWYKRYGKFQSYCNNPFTKKTEYLGLYTCQDEAHQAWGKRKHELALKLATEQPDERVANALRVRYQKYA